MRTTFCFLVLVSAISILILSGCGGPGSENKLFSKAANLGTLTVSPGEAQSGATPTVVKRNIPLGSTSGVVLMQLKLEASSIEDIQIGTMAFTTSGSGHDVNDLAVASPVSLYLDNDTDGELDSPGDTLVDSGVFDANDGSIVMNVSGTVNAGATNYYILVYDFVTSGSAAGGHDFFPALDTATAIAATGAVSGIPVLIQGPTLASPGAEIVGSLTLGMGVAPPVAGSVSSYATGVVMLQAAMTADSAEGIPLTSLTITGSGDGLENTQVQAVHLFADVNDNGTLEAGTDMPLGTPQVYTADNGTVTFSGFGYSVPAGATSHFIVVYDFYSSTGNVGFAASVASTADITALGALSGEAPFLFGGAVAGPTMTTIPTGILTISLGTNAPASNTDVIEGTLGVVMLQLNLSADATENIDISSITFTHTGTGVINPLPMDVAAFALHLDADGSGTVNAGDSLITSAATVTATTITFSGLTETILAGAANDEDWLLVYDFASGLTASGGHTFTASIVSNSHITAAGQTSGPLGVNITPTASPAYPISGPSPTATLIETLTVSVGTNDPGNQGYMPTQTLVALQIQLDATCGPVTVSSLTLTPSGSGNDGSAVISSVALYVDDGNGVYDGTETLITSGTYAGNDTARTFTFSNQTITPPTPVFWIVVYTIVGGATGDTFVVEVNQASDVSAAGTGSGRTLTVLGSFPVQGGTITYTSSTLTISASTQNPATNGAVSRNAASVLMLGLNLAANAAANVDITAITITASGMGLDNSHVSTALIYEDTNNDGVGDTLLGTNNTPFTADDGTTTFTFSSPYPQIPSGGSENWVVEYVFNPATVWVGCTFRAGVAQNSDISAQPSGGGATSVTGVGTGIHGAYRAIEGIWHQMTVQNSGLLPATGLLGHHAIYDSSTGADCMMVFGGLDPGWALHPTMWEMTLTGARNAAANTESWSVANAGGGASDPPGTAAGVYAYWMSGTTPMVVLNCGYVNQANPYTDITYFYNLSTDAWSIPATGTGPTGVGGGREGMAGIVDSSGSTPRLVTFGGSDNTPTYYNDIYTLNLTGATLSWTNVGVLTSAPSVRNYVGTVFDNSGTTARMLVLMGQSSTGASLQDAHQLSLGTTMGWATTTSPQIARSLPTAVMDNTVNSVLCFGGINSSAAINSLEVFELTSGPSVWTWTQTWSAGAPSARYWHTAVWDDNTHRMIVFGGYDGTSGNIEVWELY